MANGQPSVSAYYPWTQRPPICTRKTPVPARPPTNADRLASDDAHAPSSLDQVGRRIRAKHYSIHTDDGYVDWIRRFVLHFNKRRPGELTAAEFERFLSNLAAGWRVSAPTQNQTKSALLVLYREVLRVELDLW